MEIVFGGLILVLALYIIYKSVKASSKGKCSSGCDGCSSKGKCSGNIKIDNK